MTIKMVFEQPPENFNPKVEVAACFITVNGTVLFIKRQAHCSEPGKWGIPGGKLEKGETAHQAVLREIKEETGLHLPSEVYQPPLKNTLLGCVKTPGFNDRKASCISLIQRALRSLNRGSFHVSSKVYFSAEAGICSIKHLGTVYIRYPEVDFIYHMYGHTLSEVPKQIVIDPEEHQEYRWMTLKEALSLPLIRGEDECIYLVYGEDP